MRMRLTLIELARLAPFFDQRGILKHSVYSEHNKHQSGGAPPLEQIIE